MKLFKKQNIPYSLAGLEEMKLHPANLTFQGELKHLEERFRNSLCENPKYMFEIRVIISLTIILYSAFGILDMFLVPDNYSPLLAIRFIGFLPIAAMILLFTYSKQFGRFMNPSLMILAVAGGGGIIVMILITPPPVTYSYYAGLILVFMFVYCFGRFRFVWATATSWLLVVLYEISAIYLVDTPIPVLINNNFFFISANLIGMASCYIFEYFDRRNYYINIILSEEREKTRKANEILENRVLERTSLLNNINEDLKLEIEEKKRVEEELKKISSELEMRVDARTRDLVNANRELEFARDAANESARSKSEFLANMSHEIRTPMNAIIGMTDLSMDVGVGAEQRNEYLRIIRSSANTLLGIINDILDLSKIEAGRLYLEETPFRVREYIEGVADMFIEKINFKNLEFIVDIADDVPLRVIGDPLRLQQVLLNLISNALKFTETGEVCLSVSRGSVTRDTTELIFQVRDTGIGIDLHENRNLFDAFAQADGSVTRRYGGTGLGLAICKRIVSMMNGEIKVDSEPGKGSTFIFNVIMAKDPDTDSFYPGNANDKEALDILALISNPTLKIATTKMLNSFGFSIDIAVNEEAASTKINEHSYDILLVDSNFIESIPLLTGKAGESQDRGKLPVIVFGSLIPEREVLQLKKDGVSNYLTKPLKPSLLYQAIMEHRRSDNKTDDTEEVPYEPESCLQGMKVLLVEDNPINQIVATELLHIAGIEVSRANNGREAVEMIRDYQFDAVLMDIQMPEMGGIEATEQIRNGLDKKDLPIIAMSAHVMDDDRRKCFEAGMSYFIPKPVERKLLLGILAELKSGEILSDKELPVGKSENRLPESLPGLKINEGLSRLSCSDIIFCEIVDQFCEFYEHISDRLTGLVNDKATEAVLNEAHALKGAASNISADDLSDAAKYLEDTIRGGDYDGAGDGILRIKNAFEELQKTNSELKRILGASDI